MGTRSNRGRGLVALVASGLAVGLAAGLALGTAWSQTAGAVTAPHASLPSTMANGFWLVTPAGGVEPYGTASLGAPVGPLNQPIVAAQVTHSRAGYWLTASDGGVFNYGDAHYYGSTGNIRLNKPIVGVAATADEHGYWMVASDGGIFAFGDAGFYGSTGSLVLNKPIVGMARTVSGHGYWLVASDGGVFSFGDAGFHGSTGAITLAQPIVGLSGTVDSGGYWMVAADGGVFSFGDAGFHGSAAGTTGEPIQRLVSTGDSKGYWILAQNGTAEAFGDAVGVTPQAQTLLFRPATPGDKAVTFAFQQLGKPYIWGGNGPVGYDCSGLTLASWTHGAGIGFARVANDQYHTAGVPVAMNQLQAGDLVFWGSNTADWTTVYHAALYVGGNWIVESTGNHVQLNAVAQWGMTDVMPNGRRP